MTFVNAGTLGTIPGHRDELVAMLTQRNDLLRQLECHLHVDVKRAIAAARPKRQLNAMLATTRSFVFR